ncbi:MAG: sporulation protein YunB [Christensenellales bacterium]|jgi:sporulation protein YunB
MVIVKGLNFAKQHKKLFLWLFIIGLCFYLILRFLNNVVNPIIIESSRSKVKAMSQDAVNRAVFEVIKDATVYDSLVNIMRNDVGDIVLITSNAVQINALSREIVENAQKKLESLGQKGVNIPLGTFFGLPIFVGQGPAINIKLIPIGAINCTFSSQFISAGINQTNHKIYLEVISNVNIILPTASKNLTTTTQMLISENIIIGKVPETYLYSDEIGDLLNLVPLP